MNKEKQKAFKKFREELLGTLESILQIDNPEKMPSPDSFSNSILNIIKNNYSEIYFEAEQFGNDILYALSATGALVLERDLYISPQSVIKEVLSNPYYIDGKLTPIAEISKALILQKFSEEEGIPSEFLSVVLKDDYELEEMIKRDIANKKILTEGKFKVTHFPVVEQKEKTGTFH